MPDFEYNYDGQQDALVILEEILCRSRASGDTISKISQFLEDVNKREKARQADAVKRLRFIRKQRREYNKKHREKAKQENANQQQSA